MTQLATSFWSASRKGIASSYAFCAGAVKASLGFAITLMIRAKKAYVNYCMTALTLLGDKEIKDRLIKVSNLGSVE